MCETLKRASGEAMLFEAVDGLLHDFASFRVLLQPATDPFIGPSCYLAPG
jgi:hypothetical protein